MDFQELIYDVRDRVATIMFNRPNQLNAWTSVLEQELRRAIDMSVADRNVRGIILTGSGRAFCAGADKSRLQASASGRAIRPPIEAPKDSDTAYRYSYLLGVPKPLVAAINGPAAGVGLCISLYCDMRFMAADAFVTTSYAHRGFVAEYGVAWILPRLIGPMNAADLLFSSRRVSAVEADSIGLARKLPKEGFLDAVYDRMKEIAEQCSPRSVSVMKRQLLVGMRQNLAEACHLADIEMRAAADTEDFKEGVAHLIEKRPPNFTGV